MWGVFEIDTPGKFHDNFTLFVLCIGALELKNQYLRFILLYKLSVGA